MNCRTPAAAARKSSGRSTTRSTRGPYLPRVLLVGDSICNGYHAQVRERLLGIANVTFWASSKCVTDPDYLRELEFILEEYPLDLIHFNNGLHSLTTDRAEWEAALRNTFRMILDKLPGIRLMWCASTPADRS